MIMSILRPALAMILLLASGSRADEGGVRVMSFNIWVGGEGGGQPLERTADVIRAANADVVGLQETFGNAVSGVRPDNGAKIAKMLGWNYIDQGDQTGIATRYRIVETTPKRGGVLLETPQGWRMLMFNVHLNHAPYQPYQLLNIPYGDAPFLKTADEAVAAARAARGEEVSTVLAEIAAARRDHPDLPVFLTGDFNEPSHQDWTDRAARDGACPMPVEFPSTKAVTDAGLVDAYRALNADVVQKPGLTWTPVTRRDDPKDRHDRIDFVFVHVPGAAASDAIESVEIVGESKAQADIVVESYPSDHRAVVATIRAHAPARAKADRR